MRRLILFLSVAIIIATVAAAQGIFPKNVQRALDKARDSEKAVNDDLDALRKNQKQLEECLDTCTGKELVRKLLAQHLQLQINVLTAHQESEEASKAIDREMAKSMSQIPAKDRALIRPKAASFEYTDEGDLVKRAFDKILAPAP